MEQLFTVLLTRANCGIQDWEQLIRTESTQHHNARTLANANNCSVMQVTVSRSRTTPATSLISYTTLSKSATEKSGTVLQFYCQKYCTVSRKMYMFQRQIRLLKDLYKLIIIFYNSFITLHSPRLTAKKTGINRNGTGYENTVL